MRSALVLNASKDAGPHDRCKRGKARPSVIGSVITGRLGYRYKMDIETSKHKKCLGTVWMGT